MKKTPYFIEGKKIKLPYSGTMLIVFLLHYYQVNEIIVGIVLTLLAMVWILLIVGIYNQKRVKIDIEKFLKDYKTDE